MNFPAVILLLIYMVAVAILLVFMIFNIYHVVRYSLKTKASIAVTVLFILGLIIILGVSAYFVFQIDWNQSFRFSII